MSKLSDKDVFNLLAKKLADEISVEEDKNLNDIIASSDEAKTALNNAHHIWSTKYFSDVSPDLISQKENSEKIWHEAFGRESIGYSNRSKLVFLKFAATFIILISAAIAIFYLFDKPKQTESEVSTIQKHTLPGQKSAITLRDGTIVWLNSGSRISYQSDFNDSLRVLRLEGQAFFDIFKDQSKPFVVKCGDLEIEALGTSFDVRGYSESPIQVSLLTGSVKLSLHPEHLDEDNVILKPGEYSVVGINNTFIEKGKFDAYEVLAWKEGRLIFDNETIGEILPKLELWYGVEISNQLTFNMEKPYSSTFEQENLDNILLNMGEVLNFNYEIKGNDVTLKN